MSEPRERAIEIAAQCWCDDRNAKTVMDSDLALSFAERLDAQMAKTDAALAVIDVAHSALTTAYAVLYNNGAQGPFTKDILGQALQKIAQFKNKGGE